MTDDPWVMHLVVRKDHPLSLRRAMTLAGAGVVRCADRFRTSPEWADAFAAWGTRPRKVALRAGAAEVDELLERLDAAAVRTEMGVTLLALPPRRRSRSDPLVASLRPYTDGPGPAEEPEPPPGPRLVYAIRPGVLRTAGKAMAQAGHAALMAADTLGPRRPEAFAAWRAAGCPGEVEEVDAERWARLRASPDTVVVADAGLTQVEPGTETVIALPPGAA